MVFIDSNIPMYLVGADHPNKATALASLESVIRDERRLVSSVEVLQEILHRYHAIGRPDAIEPAFDVLLDIVDEVFEVTLPDALRAKEIVLEGAQLSARDALHIAVMERESVSAILSFDAGFDRWPSVERIGGEGRD
jgi:predicted nucleic acid-binding protein